MLVHSNTGVRDLTLTLLDLHIHVRDRARLPCKPKSTADSRAGNKHAPEAPAGALAAMATAAFITVLTEALPGGLLPAMSAGLRVGESSMGQAVTFYAIGSAVVAIPSSAATSGWRRKQLLLTTMAGFTTPLAGRIDVKATRGGWQGAVSSWRGARSRCSPA